MAEIAKKKKGRKKKTTEVMIKKREKGRGKYIFRPKRGLFDVSQRRKKIKKKRITRLREKKIPVR